MVAYGYQNRSRLRSRMVRLVNENAALRRGSSGDTFNQGGETVIVHMNVDYVSSVWAKREEVLLDSLIGSSLEIIQDFDFCRQSILDGVRKLTRGRSGGSGGNGGSGSAEEYAEKKWWDDFGDERDVWIFFRRDIIKMAQEFEARLERDMMEKEKRLNIVGVNVVGVGVRGFAERDYYKDVVDAVRKRVAEAVLASLECEEKRGDQAPGSTEKARSKMASKKVKELGKRKSTGYIPTGKPRGRPKRDADIRE